MNNILRRNSPEKQRNAFLAVHDKVGIPRFASELTQAGWNVYATSGTLRTIRGDEEVRGKSRLRNINALVADALGVDPKSRILTRRTVAGLLMARLLDDAEAYQKNIPSEAPKRTELPQIDLVCVGMQPLPEEPSSLAQTHRIEDRDGAGLLLAAAQGGSIVVSSSEQYDPVMAWLQGGELNRDEFVDHLARQAGSVALNYLHESNEAYALVAGHVLGKSE